MKNRKLQILFLAALVITLPVDAQEKDDEFSLEFEGGMVGQTYNDIQVPNDSTGTRFALNDVIGNGGFSSFRFTANWKLSPGHEMKLVLAPFEASETGNIESLVWYDEVQFDPGEVLATYKFNTYRFTYAYTFSETDKLKLKIGFTGLIRDADVSLEQGERKTNNDNIGFVPLLNFKSEYQFAEKARLDFEFNGLAGGPGRLLEGDLRLKFDLSDNLFAGAGFRVLEGGADVDSVYNFAMFYSGYVFTGFSF